MTDGKQTHPNTPAYRGSISKPRIARLMPPVFALHIRSTLRRLEALIDAIAARETDTTTGYTYSDGPPYREEAILPRFPFVQRSEFDVVRNITASPA
ncbi:MAG: hypothetical protein NT133_11725 [Alphaproteobacteria bacterium]|nr:hypothetical protein [Alphaproteobacteria bacterium]